MIINIKEILDGGPDALTDFVIRHLREHFEQCGRKVKHQNIVRHVVGNSEGNRKHFTNHVHWQFATKEKVSVRVRSKRVADHSWEISTGLLGSQKINEILHHPLLYVFLRDRPAYAIYGKLYLCCDSKGDLISRGSQYGYEVLYGLMLNKGYVIDLSDTPLYRTITWEGRKAFDYPIMGRAFFYEEAQIRQQEYRDIYENHVREMTSKGYVHVPHLLKFL